MKIRDLCAAAGVIALLAAPAFADDHDEDDDETPWAVAEVFFELNDTDGDLGIHALSLIHISEPTRRNQSSRMPSSA